MCLQETRVQVEDLGRQILARGFKEPIDETCAKIEAVMLADLRRVADRVLRPSAGRSGEPSIVVQGNLDRYLPARETLVRFGFAPPHKVRL